MNTITILILALSLVTCYAVPNKTFPRYFKFGTATASYQIEGGWKEDGKGENIWDNLVHHRPELIENGDTGDIACNSYHKYKEDIKLLKELGVDFYRFSLSWSRILPDGFANNTNQAGIDYYKDLIFRLIDNGIEPMVTLYHWDLPQPLQDIGGWPNEELIEHFANYARICFENFGPFVKTWATFNEVHQVCQQGYGSGTKAPAIVGNGIMDYLCSHTVLKAHAKAYHIYDEEFRAIQKGKVSMVIDTDWIQPNSTSEEDEIAAETRRQFTFGWYANPIFKGDYPQIMKDRIAMRSQKEGFPQSRLPEFTPEEIEYIKGTHDYLALNHYTTNLVKNNPEPQIGDPSWEKDIGIYTFKDPSWEDSGSSWLKIVPWGLRKLLKWLKDTYDNPEIIITENGVSDHGTLDDDIRIRYYKEYLGSVLEAITEDGVNVTGYTAWSLMDNFEWMRGYTEKFGLYNVDFNSPNRTRTPKKSVGYYKQVVATHCLLEKCQE